MNLQEDVFRAVNLLHEDITRMAVGLMTPWANELGSNKMSLHEAVLEIAQQMTDAAHRPAGAGLPLDLQRELLAFAAQLRSACLAAGETPREDPQAQHRRMIQEAKKEFRGKALFPSPGELAAGEDALEGRMVLVEGSDPPLTVMISPTMPAGACVQFDGVVYQLQEDGKLHDFSGVKKD